MFAYQLTLKERENLMLIKKIAAVTEPASMRTGIYRTRNGRKATILSDNVPGDFPLLGYLENKDGIITPAVWRRKGTGVIDIDDLITVWSDIQEVTVTFYVGLDEQGAAVISYVAPKKGDFIGVQKVTVTVKEGDVLDVAKD